jgi:hypothetical protein
MAQVDVYRQQLRAMPRGSWWEFLRANSNLPGPRGNLELAEAVAAEGDRELFLTYARIGADEAPENTPEAFLAFCGVLGLGTLAAMGDDEALERLRGHASDPRWRIREAVAMALQRVGDEDVDRLLTVAEAWAAGNALEQRAAAAAVCEPRLLREQRHAPRVLALLDQITRSLAATVDRRRDDFRALRKGLAYCWSVAVAAYPEVGKAAFQGWVATTDPDVRWVLRENLKKKRLASIDPAWVSALLKRLA